MHRLIFYYEIIHGKGSRQGVFSRYSVANARSKNHNLPCTKMGVVRRPLVCAGATSPSEAVDFESLYWLNTLARVSFAEPLSCSPFLRCNIFVP